MTKPRILWLIKGLGLGGAEQLLASAAPHLSQHEFDYVAAYFLPWKDALVHELENAGVPVDCLNCRSLASPKAWWRLRSYVARHKFDLIHAHLAWSGILGRVVAWHRHIPVIYTEHGCWNRLHPATRCINRCTWRLNDITVAVSDEVASSIASWSKTLPVTIPNGIDCRRLAATPDDSMLVRQEFDVPANDYLIINVANLSPVKAHETLISAFAAFYTHRPAATLLLVGQFRERKDDLEALAQRLNIAHAVRFAGPRTDVPRLLRAADVFALSSNSEGLPISLLEAMALAKPVVCTAVGGIPGVIESGENGLLVAPKEPQLLAAALEHLHQNPAFARALGEQGQRTVQSQFDISNMVGATEQLYRELLTGRRNASEQQPASSL